MILIIMIKVILLAIKIVDDSDSCNNILIDKNDRNNNLKRKNNFDNLPKMQEKIINLI